jgi:hypothetical protein
MLMLLHCAVQAKQLRVKLHAFIKYCLLPRLTRSAADAVYCHFFCLKLHELDVPYWPAGFFWDDVSVLGGCMSRAMAYKAVGYEVVPCGGCAGGGGAPMCL